MAFLGADTEELREVGQEFQEGKEATDQVISYLRILIAILRAASFFSGGASLAYAEYLETTVVPWLQKISAALGLFAKVLGAQADAQDEVSNGATVNFSSLPTYSSPTMPEPIRAFEGGSIAGPTGAVPGATGTGATGAGAGAGAPLGQPGTIAGPSLSIGANGHLMIDTGIDLDGPDVPDVPVAPGTGGSIDGGTGAPAAGTAGGGSAGAGPGGQYGNLPIGGQVSIDPRSAGATPGGDAAPAAFGGGTPGGGATPGGSTSGGSPLGGGPASGNTSGNTSELGGGSALSGVSPTSSASPPADGGFGGATPGAGAMGSTEMSTPAALGSPSEGASYGAAAGIAGGAAALGLGGAALASRGGSGADSEIDRLASSNGRGSRGEDVTALQDKLTAAGYDTQGSDGVWGSNTQAAYDAYRTDHPLPVSLGQGYTSPGGYDYTQITGVRGNANVTPEFLRGVEGMASRLGARPEHIMAAMSFETGGTFASDVRNPRSSATGLIQFMGATATGLGTTTADLARMTPTEQLTYVEQYFAPYRGRLGDLESVYTSILAGHPASGNDALFTQGQGNAYAPNRELDVNRDGVITAAEATQHVRARMGSGSN